MNIKTRLLSTLFLVLLLTPVLISGSQENSGTVLGVIEDNSQPSARQAEIGQIAGGVMETKNDSLETKSVTGKVIWIEDLEATAITDKFSLASSVLVESDTKSLNLVIGGTNRTLAPDTVLLVNRETFISLGGNPETQESIEAVVTQKS